MHYLARCRSFEWGDKWSWRRKLRVESGATERWEVMYRQSRSILFPIICIIICCHGCQCWLLRTPSLTARRKCRKLVSWQHIDMWCVKVNRNVLMHRHEARSGWYKAEMIRDAAVAVLAVITARHQRDNYASVVINEALPPWINYDWRIISLS